MELLVIKAEAGVVMEANVIVMEEIVIAVVVIATAN